ncbi:MAG: hypothetical protein AAF558_03630, partial [Verrucomicrobiota bacterium]
PEAVEARDQALKLLEELRDLLQESSENPDDSRQENQESREPESEEKKEAEESEPQIDTKLLKELTLQKDIFKGSLEDPNSTSSRQPVEKDW